MDKEILKFTIEDAQDIISGLNKNFVTIEKEITGTSRWSIKYSIVIQRLSDGKFFKSRYSKGATELQDEQPYEYEDEAIFKEVLPVEEMVIVYK
jgi:hypothetical protein